MVNEHETSGEAAALCNAPAGSDRADDRGLPTSRAQGRSLLLCTLAAAVLSIATLSAHAGLFEARPHIANPYLDQLGYITTARRLLDEGELRPGFVFPAQVENPHYRPYMPGHYLALAASFALFGWGALPTLLPSLLGHLIATLAAFWIGNRLYGRWQGLVAALFVATFPPIVTYSFTAMAELTLIAASMGALALFVHLPRRIQPWSAPFLLAVPFLFRETGALFLLPMAGLVLCGGPRLAWRAVISMGAASAVLLWTMQEWQVASGKGELPFVTRILEGSFNYGDAFPGPAPELSLSGWLAAVATNAWRNLGLIRETVQVKPGALSTVGFLVIAGVCISVLLVGLRRWRRDGFLLGTGLLGGITLILLFTLYDVRNERALRSTLFVFPLSTVALVGAFLPRDLPARLSALSRARRWLVLGVGAGIAAGLLGLGRGATARAAGDLLAWESAIRECSKLLERVHGADERMLVSPLDMSGDYLLHRYPLRGASLPYNDETFELLLEKYPVGTLLMPIDWLDQKISAAVLEKHSFQLVGSGNVLVYRVPPTER